MFKKLFGPFPDEPLLYSLDRILGLFHKFDTKSERKDAENQIDFLVPVEPVNEKSNDVIEETTTENDVTVMNKISFEILETTSHSSKKSTIECITILESNKVNETTEVPHQSDHDSTPRSVLKTSSSMECNYPLSKMNVINKSLHTAPKIATKRVNSCTKFSTKRYGHSKGFGDSVAVVENKFERKLFRSDGKHRFESVLKKESKQQKVIASSSTDIKRDERLMDKNTFSQLPIRQKRIGKNVKLNDRKLIKTEWAVTRIYTFDDDSKTYEIMKKDKVLDKCDGIERIFAITPNLTTVAFDPVKGKVK